MLTRMYLSTKSPDYFHGNIYILNTLDTSLLASLKTYLGKAFSTSKTNHDPENYIRALKTVTNDSPHNSWLTYHVTGQADWALTDHLDDVFLKPLTATERTEFCELLYKNHKQIYLELDEYEPDRKLLHSITAYLDAHMNENGDPVLYLRDYYYDDYDFTKANIYEMQFADGIKVNSREYFNLIRELTHNKPLCTLWKTKYHKDRLELVIALNRLINGRDHQGVILTQELQDTNYFLEKLNKAHKRA